MRASNCGIRFSAILLAACLVPVLLSPVRVLGSECGRLSGIVIDAHGNPLMGVTVLVIGPTLIPTASAADQVERVVTNAKGKFAVGDLIPGWYSLQVFSPMRLPAHQSGIRVEAGETSTLRFVMADFFAPLRFQVPNSSANPLSDDWKWVLRTSSATRPILRFKREVAKSGGNSVKRPRPASERLLGVFPGFSRQAPLASDPGVGSVFAYLRSLSQDTDLLVAGSMASGGNQTSAVATAFRKGLVDGNPTEISLVVHQLGYTGGVSLPGGSGQLSNSYAQGLVASYMRTRHLYPHMTLTAGMDVNYLNAFCDVVSARPRMRLAYRVSDATVVALQYGARPRDDSGTLVDRVGELNSFPLVTLRNYRPEIEQASHTEISLDHRLNGSAQVQVAAYGDGVRNAAVWSSAQPAAVGWLAGNYTVNSAVNGIFINVGDYQSFGYRAAYLQRMGNSVEALVAYFVGNSMSAPGVVGPSPACSVQGMLRPVRSASLAERVSARMPVTHTQVIASYEWVQRGRVTMADPYGQADLELQPFLGVQIRQPLPALAFLPAHIEAVADFRNLCGQGYSSLTPPGEMPLLLSPAYRSIRGGFSVQF